MVGFITNFWKLHYSWLRSHINANQCRSGCETVLTNETQKADPNVCGQKIITVCLLFLEFKLLFWTHYIQAFTNTKPCQEDPKTVPLSKCGTNCPCLLYLVFIWIMAGDSASPLTLSMGLTASTSTSISQYLRVIYNESLKGLCHDMDIFLKDYKIT